MALTDATTKQRTTGEAGGWTKSQENLHQRRAPVHGALAVTELPGALTTGTTW